MDTIEDATAGRAPASTAAPGMVVVFAREAPTLRALPLVSGRLTIGRGELAALGLDDDRASRRHLGVHFDGARFRFADLGSRNGTFVDGERIRAEIVVRAPNVVRIGRTLLMPTLDIRPFVDAKVDHRADGIVVGPTLRAAWDELSRAARAGDAVTIRGESGTGKSLAAREFHATTDAKGAFVEHHVATGGGRQALASALSAARGGTLLVDDVAELDAPSQSELLGALSKGRRDVRLVCATSKNLRDEVVAKRLREDLFFRVGRPEIVLPPLRARREDIAPLLALALAGVSKTLGPRTSLVEAAALRWWPGNVRELLVEARRAALAVSAEQRSHVEATDLDPDAGRAFDPVEDARPKTLATADPARVEEALRQASGNVTAAARLLGIHRNQLRRWLAKRQIDPTTFGGDKE